MNIEDNMADYYGDLNSRSHWCCPWDHVGPCSPNDPRAGRGLHSTCGWQDRCDDPDHEIEGDDHE